MKTIKEIKQDLDTKLWAFRYRVETKARATARWASENKELALAMIPVGVMLFRSAEKAVRSVDRKIDLKKEERFRDLSVYDHSLGMYHELKRPLKPEEKVELSMRIKAGESKIDVLNDMRLLK